MKEFFDFAKKDRNAILLLLLIIIVIAFYKYFSSNKPSTGSPLLIVDSTQKNIQKNYSSNNLNKAEDIEKHAPIFYKKSIYEINAADSLQLDSLRLIGMKTANRIIKYRNLLGGFYSLEQLKEVWGFKDSMLIMNQSRLTVDASKIKKININQASVEILKMHPYIHYQKAVVMNNFRKAHGNFKTMDDIKNTKVFTDAELEKLSPYISF